MTRPHPLRAVLALARAADPPDTIPEPLRSQLLGTRAVARALAVDIRAWLNEAPVAHAELAGVPRVTLWKDMRCLAPADPQQDQEKTTP